MLEIDSILDTGISVMGLKKIARILRSKNLISATDLSDFITSARQNEARLKRKETELEKKTKLLKLIRNKLAKLK